MKIWIISSCIPEDGIPAIPEIFTDEGSATKRFDDIMRIEWETQAIESDDCDSLLPYPADGAETAHNIIVESNADSDVVWGQYCITSHELETGQ